MATAVEQVIELGEIRQQHEDENERRSRERWTRRYGEDFVHRILAEFSTIQDFIKAPYDHPLHKECDLLRQKEFEEEQAYRRQLSPTLQKVIQAEEENHRKDRMLKALLTAVAKQEGRNVLTFPGQGSVA